jgi:SAM-dependent methyltransferase
MRLARETRRRHGVGGDVHAPVAARLVAEGLLPVVDIGCGEGKLRRHLPAGTWVGVDSSQTMVAGAPAGARLARADALPFSAGSFGAAALLYVLYHLDDPATALVEARRVVRTGGLVAVATPSRHDLPELAFALPDRPLTLDAETTPGLMAEHFA